MRKFLLFGTMLGVASAALAFGGMFNHGSKSSTYKGGVDAIGVHFGGEKKTADTKPVTNTCGDGTPCGDGCCQLDNVCQQNESGEYQCCDKDLTTCCPVNQGVYTYDDWSMGYQIKTCCNGIIYCPTVGTDGNCATDYYHCCENGEKPYVASRLSYGDGYACCDGTTFEGVGFNGGDLCCPKNSQPYCAYRDSEGNCETHYCCGNDQSVSCAWKDSNGVCRNSTCCEQGQKAYCANIGPYDSCSGPVAQCCDGEVSYVWSYANSSNGSWHGSCTSGE